MPVPPIVPDPRPLLTFVDAQPVAMVGVGFVLAAVLGVTFIGLTVVVRASRPAPRHRPSGGRLRVPLPVTGVTWPPKHTAAALAETQQLPVHPSYLGPDVERAQQLPAVRREPVTTGGAR